MGSPRWRAEAPAALECKRGCDVAVTVQWSSMLYLLSIVLVFCFFVGSAWNNNGNIIIVGRWVADNGDGIFVFVDSVKGDGSE